MEIVGLIVACLVMVFSVMTPIMLLLYQQNAQRFIQSHMSSDASRLPPILADV